MKERIFNNEDPIALKLELEILRFNHLEHFKANKDLVMILGAGHPKVVAIQNEMNNIVHQMKELQQKIG